MLLAGQPGIATARVNTLFELQINEAAGGPRCHAWIHAVQVRRIYYDHSTSALLALHWHSIGTPLALHWHSIGTLSVTHVLFGLLTRSSACAW